MVENFTILDLGLALQLGGGGADSTPVGCPPDLFSQSAFLYFLCGCQPWSKRVVQVLCYVMSATTSHLTTTTASVLCIRNNRLNRLAVDYPRVTCEGVCARYFP